MRASLILLTALLAFGCDDAPQAADGGPPAADALPVPNEPLPQSAEAGAETQRLKALVDDGLALDADGVLARFAVPFADDLGFDPLEAQNLEIIQASPLALDDDELAVLAEHGFVISGRQPVGSFIAGYERVYNADLPVYISADSLLHTLHRVYGKLLKQIEIGTLRPAMDRWLAHLHTRLAAGEGAAWGPEVVADVDLYLTVARSLLADEAVAPV
ncbi:MAG: DUF3160 domain-containing protein, partial [Myxococcales bacterium]|nr:DUF3160 domain-containing protein [Myxococcales bacterium]